MYESLYSGGFTRYDDVAPNVSGMTLIAAVRDIYGNILLAADSEEDGRDTTVTLRNKGPVRKLMQVGGRPVVWGWHGTDAVGDPFGRWITGPNVNWLDWDAFEISALTELQRISSDAGAKWGTVGTEWKTGFVIAGTIGNKLDMWGRTIGDPIQSQVDENGLFVGAASNCAWIGWKHIRTHFGISAQSFQDWLTTVTREAEGVKPPVQMWRLTPGDCRELWFK